MKVLDINSWNRKQHYDHFSNLMDPYFAITVPFDVTKAYRFSKEKNISFFAKYLHDCMKAINEIPSLKLRIVDGNVVEFDTIHASATLMRGDNTFGFSFIDFHDDLGVFINNILLEKNRIKNSTALFPPKNGLNCIHCSAMPWFNFTGHKEPVSKQVDSVPKIAFSKVIETNNMMSMNVSISVNHALVDGYDIGLFSERFQYYLTK